MSVNTVLSFMIGLEQSIYLSTSGIYEPSINALCLSHNKSVFACFQILEPTMNQWA